MREAGEVDDLTASAILSRSRGTSSVAEERAAAAQLVLAARWADLHPPESIHDAAAFTVPGCEHEEPIAGEGAPLVAEFCLAELGTVLGISTTAAKKLVGHALELRHRLPRLWAQVQAGRVPAWRARTVAEATIHSTPALTVEAAAFVDAQVAAVAGRVGAAQLDRLVAEAIKRFDLAEVDPTAGSGGRLPPRRPAPRDASTRRRRPLRRHDADRGRARPRRRPRPRPRRRPRGRNPEPPRLRPSRSPCGARRPSATSPGPRPPSTSTPTAPPAPAMPTACPPPARSCSTPTSTRPSTDWTPSSVRPGGWRKASASSSSTRSGLVRRLPHQGHRQARHRPQRRPRHTGVRGPRPDPRAGDPPGSHVRVPVVHPPGPGLRHRPRRRVRPRRRSRRPTTTRPHPDRQPRRAVPLPPPPQDPHHLALPHDRAGGASSGPHRTATATDATATAPPRSTEPATRPARHPATTPTMTPPHTPPPTR